MSPRDLPYWARGVAALLVCFATWWLLGTQALRSVVGDSIALLSLGVIAVFMLRGMQLPLGLWPDGPWRARFSAPAIIGVALVFSILIGIRVFGSAPTVTPDLDVGVVMAVVVGAVAWGFAVASVHQRPYLIWYVVAVALGMFPPVVGFLFFGGADGPEVNLVRLVSTDMLSTQELAPTAATTTVPTFLYLVAVGAASKLVTEEIAFRRLLVGQPSQAGIVSVTSGAVVAAIWYAIVLQTGSLAAGTAVQFGLAAFCAGALYGVARSLLVSTTFSAVYWASFSTFILAPDAAGGAEFSVVGRSPSVTILTLVVGLVLGVFVVRRNGWLGSALRREVASVTSD